MKKIHQIILIVKKFKRFDTNNNKIERDDDNHSICTNQSEISDYDSNSDSDLYSFNSIQKHYSKNNHQNINNNTTNKSSNNPSTLKSKIIDIESESESENESENENDGGKLDVPIRHVGKNNIMNKLSDADRKLFEQKVENNTDFCDFISNADSNKIAAKDIEFIDKYDQFKNWDENDDEYCDEDRYIDITKDIEFLHKSISVTMTCYLRTDKKLIISDFCAVPQYNGYGSLAIKNIHNLCNKKGIIIYIVRIEQISINFWKKMKDLGYVTYNPKYDNQK